MTPLTQNIRRLRIAAGISQENAARRLGVTMGTWWRWETGRHKPDLDTLQRIADLLQTTPSKLLEEQ